MTAEHSSGPGKLGLETAIVDPAALERTVEHFRNAGVLLPTFAQLSDPSTIPESIAARLTTVDRDAADPLNLFRVHWHNPPRGSTASGADTVGTIAVPDHIELPPALTGVEARIVLLLGDTFPMIRAHKVLAAYSCLVPRLVTGQFDPTRHRAIWPSTGNYCRGGIAISRILGCRGVAVLPEGMSRERFEWLERWVGEPADIDRTPGTESNVKEIYDRCAELERDSQNVVFNQFSELGNHLGHVLVTGRAAEHVFQAMTAARPELRLRAFVSATGSAGTLGAADYLKEQFGTLAVAVEALECPTLLYNGFGEHNIQGIGDKHVPLIHNVMNTDVVTAVSDHATDALAVLFASDSGRHYLAQRQNVPEETIGALERLGLSSICNVLGAIKVAKYFDLDRNDVLMTVATDGAELYGSERDRITERDFGGSFDELEAAAVFGRRLLGTATDHLLELDRQDRERIFNLGYYTWVEQQGVSIEDFTARKRQGFWRDLRRLIGVWDERIEELNRRVGLAAG